MDPSVLFLLLQLLLHRQFRKERQARAKLRPQHLQAIQDHRYGFQQGNKQNWMENCAYLLKQLNMENIYRESGTKKSTKFRAKISI
jgi:hypothetical protein